jgi:hypothetical protein
MGNIVITHFLGVGRSHLLGPLLNSLSIKQKGINRVLSLSLSLSFSLVVIIFIITLIGVAEAMAECVEAPGINIGQG